MRRVFRFLFAAGLYLVSYVAASFAAWLAFVIVGAAPNFAFEFDQLVYTYLVFQPLLSIALLIPVVAYELLLVRLGSKRLALLIFGLIATVFIDLLISRVVYGGLPLADRLPDDPEPPFSTYLLQMLVQSIPAGFAAALVWVGLKRLVARALA